MSTIRGIRTALTALAVALATAACDFYDCRDFGYDFCCLDGTAVVGCEEIGPFFFPGGGGGGGGGGQPPPPPPRIFTDASGELERIISANDIFIDDIQFVAGSGNDAVEFVIPRSPRFAYPGDFFGACPESMVMISGPALGPFFGGAPEGGQLCVQANPIEPSVDLLRRLDSVASGSAADLPGAVDVLGPESDELPFEELLRVVCRILERGTSLCITNNGNFYFNPFQGFIPIIGSCPVPILREELDACIDRGLQTPDICFTIACVEQLNRLGTIPCTAALSGFGPIKARLVCELIRDRDHFYVTKERTICSTADSPSCNVDFVERVARSDVRNQAPFVLEGPPSGGKAAPVLRSPRPIQFGSDFTTLLGQPKFRIFGLEIFVNDFLNSSNPIYFQEEPATVGGRRCLTNITKQDHLLVGKITACLREVNVGGQIEVKSLVTGTGENTRFALTNEIVGPGVLATAQKALRASVQAALKSGTFRVGSEPEPAPEPPPLPEPPPSCGRPPCIKKEFDELPL